MKEYMTLENASIVELMSEMVKYTSSGKLVESVFNFINKHESILEEEEYLEIEKAPMIYKPGVYNTMLLNANYSINIRKSLIIFLMLVLDSKMTKGIASTCLVLTGVSAQTIHKISEYERCILLDTLIGQKWIAEDYLYFNQECVQNDITCPYRKDYQCCRSLDNIEMLLDDLKTKQILNNKNGVIKISF